jgi:tetratricopeptide (TPR) repeat protein
LHLQRRSGQPHQRNLRDLVSWSLERLGPGERTALLALSVFPGRFGTADAKRLLAEVPDADGAALPELVRRSLADLDGERYRLLRVIRDAAREELGARPELDTAAQQALLQWALDGCPPATERRFGDPDDFDSALAVEAALRWGLAAGRPGLHPLMRRLRRWSQETCDSAGVRELAREVLARPVPETSDEVILQAMAAEVATGLGWTTLEETATVERARRLVELARAGGDPQARYEASSAAAMALSKAGCPAEALACALEALELTEGVPQLRSWRAIELGNLALLHYVAGDLERAEAAMREALVAHEQDGDRINAAVNRCNLGELLLDRGDAPAAEEQLRAALRSADGVRAPTGVAMALLVEALTARGATAEAGELAREAVPALEQLAAGDPSMAAQLERLRGVVAALPGH